MALVKCKECEKEVSDKAGVCPGCGCPIETALIKCSECGKEISAKASACPGCGYPVAVEHSSTAPIPAPHEKVQIWRTVSKSGFLLVFIGFFLPWVSIGGWFEADTLNGFGVANLRAQTDGINGSFLYVFFAVALAGIVLGVLLLMQKKVPVVIDWVLTHCIATPLVTIFFMQNQNMIDVRAGLYLILVGAIVAAVAQIISAALGETPQITPNIGKTSTAIHNQTVSASSDDVNNSPNAGWSILGFFIPPVGLILFLVWIGISPKKAKSCGIGALIGFGVMAALILSVLTIAGNPYW